MNGGRPRGLGERATLERPPIIRYQPPGRRLPIKSCLPFFFVGCALSRWVDHGEKVVKLLQQKMTSMSFDLSIWKTPVVDTTSSAQPWQQNSAAAAKPTRSGRGWLTNAGAKRRSRRSSARRVPKSAGEKSWGASLKTARFGTRLTQRSRARAK